jgi:hypothetical protein
MNWNAIWARPTGPEPCAPEIRFCSRLHYSGCDAEDFFRASATYSAANRAADCCAAALHFAFTLKTLGFSICNEGSGGSLMAVLDHDHHLTEHRQIIGGTSQFCLFWVGMFAVIALLGLLFKS